MRRLRIIWDLLFSYTYVVLTDKNATIYIPLMDLDKMQNQVILGSQKASLKEFRDRLTEVIKEHDRQTKLLQHRKRNSRNKV